MKKRTRKLQFDKKAKLEIRERDGQCIFCQQQYHMEKCTSMLALEIEDYMHYINKSAGGLGIAKNGVLGCRYHHQLLDNGNLGLRTEMLDMMKAHLTARYPDWNEDDLVYKKYDF